MIMCQTIAFYMFFGIIILYFVDTLRDSSMVETEVLNCVYPILIAVIAYHVGGMTSILERPTFDAVIESAFDIFINKTNN